MCDLLNLTILTPFIAHCWFQKCGKCEIICQNVMLVWRLTVFYFYFDSLAFFHAKSLFLRSCFFIIHTILVVMVQPVYTHSQNHYVVRLLRTWGRWNFVMNFEMYCILIYGTSRFSCCWFYQRQFHVTMDWQGLAEKKTPTINALTALKVVWMNDNL